MALAALAMVLSMVAVAAGQRGGDTPADNWILTALGLVMAASVVGAFATGVSASSWPTNGLSRSCS